jgi:hypothetical protein
MQRQGQDEFLIENIQPSQSKNPRLTNLFKVLVAISIVVETSIAIFLSFNILTIGTAFTPDKIQYHLIRITGLSFTLGTLTGFYFFLVSVQASINKIEIFEAISFNLSSLFRKIMTNWWKYFNSASEITGRTVIFAFILSSTWIWLDPENIGNSYYSSLHPENSLFSLSFPRFSFSLDFPYDFLLAFTFIGGIMGISVGIAYILVNLAIEEKAIKRKPNQGIINAAKLALVMPLLYFLIASFIFSASLFRLSQSSSPVDIFPATIIFTFPFLGLFFVFSDVNLILIKHFSLRLVLYYAGCIPWNYARFLNHCTERLLLQRVGGRYRFIHKLVQEHFAAMPFEDSPYRLNHEP